MKNLFCNLRFKRCGFTLVEVLVLVLILGILAAVSVPTYQKIIKRSYVADGLKSLDMLAGAQDKYFIENGMYARNLEDLNTPLKGYNNDAKLHNIHTTNFDYNQEQNRYCIKASSNIAAYALVKNYKDKNNIFCVGNDCSEFAKYITEATTDQYAELCPVDENWNSNLTEEEKAKEERGAACQHPCNPFTFTPVTWSDNEPCTNAGKKSGKGIGNGTPGHGQEECKVLEYTTVCENKPGIGWCENKKTSCVPKDCAKYMGAGYHLAGNNYPGYNRCACVKDCGPNTCPVPTCKKQICDPTSGSLPGNGGGVSPRSLSTCGVQNITGEKSVCNFSTGVWQCSHETDPCVAVSPEGLGDPCDGRPTHPDAVEGNTCGIKRIDLCRLNDSCSGVDATTKCVLNTDVGNKCFTGEITTNGCSNGHYKTCEDCKWSECSSCDLNTKPESQEKECMTADGRCGIKILTNPYCDNGNWVFADDPNIECDGHYGLAPNNPPNSIWVAGNCFKQHQEWQCKITGWEAVPTGPYYTDNQTGVWVGGGLFGQMHFHANNCSNDNKDINGNPLPSGVWCENCIQHKCPESAVRNVHYGNKCWKSFKDDYVLVLHNSLVVYRGQTCMTRVPANFLACATGFVNSQIGHSSHQCQQSNIWQCNPTNSPYLGEREVIQVSSEELINYCATASYPTKLATDYVLPGNISYQGIIPCLDPEGAWIICSPYEIPNANFDVCSELPSEPIYSD